MITMKCPSCGKEEMRLQVVADYETRLGGVPVVVPDARIGTCANCGETLVCADELERWRDLQRQQLQDAGQVPSAREVSRTRESLGLSVSDFAVLMGVSRQTIHAWERQDGRGMQFGPASLLVDLLREQLSGELTGICRALVAAALSRGQEVRSADNNPRCEAPPASATQGRFGSGLRLRARRSGAPSFGNWAA